jgi:hypothetical protein
VDYIFITTYLLLSSKWAVAHGQIVPFYYQKPRLPRMIYKHGIKHRYGSDLHNHYSLTHSEWLKVDRKNWESSRLQTPLPPPPLVSSHPQVEVSSPIAAFPFYHKQHQITYQITCKLSHGFNFCWFQWRVVWPYEHNFKLLDTSLVHNLLALYCV